MLSIGNDSVQISSRIYTPNPKQKSIRIHGAPLFEIGQLGQLVPQSLRKPIRIHGALLFEISQLSPNLNFGTTISATMTNALVTYIPLVQSRD